MTTFTPTAEAMRLVMLDLLDPEPHPAFGTPAISLEALTTVLHCDQASLDFARVITAAQTAAQQRLPTAVSPKVKSIRREPGLEKEYWIIFQDVPPEAATRVPETASAPVPGRPRMTPHMASHSVPSRRSEPRPAMPTSRSDSIEAYQRRPLPPPPAPVQTPISPNDEPVNAFPEPARNVSSTTLAPLASIQTERRKDHPLKSGTKAFIKGLVGRKDSPDATLPKSDPKHVVKFETTHMDTVGARVETPAPALSPEETPSVRVQGAEIARTRPTRKETIQGPGGEDSWQIIDSYGQSTDGVSEGEGLDVENGPDFDEAVRDEASLSVRSVDPKVLPRQTHLPYLVETGKESEQSENRDSQRRPPSAEDLMQEDWESSYRATKRRMVPHPPSTKGEVRDDVLQPLQVDGSNKRKLQAGSLDDHGGSQARVSRDAASHRSRSRETESRAEAISRHRKRQTRRPDASSLGSPHSHGQHAETRSTSMAERGGTVNRASSHSERANHLHRHARREEPQRRSEPADDVRDAPTPFWIKTFEGLPFGPDLPAVEARVWLREHWKVLVVQTAGILTVVYAIQASGW